MATSAASAGVGALGALQSGEANRRKFEYQAGIAAINRETALKNAAYALRTGEAQALRTGMGQRFRMGNIITKQAASGIDLNSGSAAEVRAGQGLVDRMDQTTIRENAARRAFGHMVEAESASQSGVLASRAAEDATQAGRMGAVQSLLSGATSVSSKWLQGDQLGMFQRHPYDVALDHLYGA